MQTIEIWAVYDLAEVQPDPGLPTPAALQARWVNYAAATGTDYQPVFDLTDLRFWSFTNQVMLSRIGFCYADAHRYQQIRRQQLDTTVEIEMAYGKTGLDRNAVHEAIAAAMEPHMENGVWAKSTGAYGAACAEADACMLRNDGFYKISQADLVYGSLAGWKGGY